MRKFNYPRYGFTLIELSIVLVIIGLIVGGILTGRDLIKSAAVRAQVSQIEKYQTAVNTFKGKYGQLPGDLSQSVATQFGFASRNLMPTPNGNLNGILEGNYTVNGPSLACGETGLFWMDLSQAKLVDGLFSALSNGACPGSIAATAISKYMPEAKIGSGSFVYVWSGGWAAAGGGGSDSRNYFGLSGVAEPIAPMMATTLTVSQAAAIDKKMDDGLPQSGDVLAIYPNYQARDPADNYYSVWAYSFPLSGIGGGACGSTNTCGPVTPADSVATSPDSMSCYDNNGVSGATEKYSLSSNAEIANCALSFRFQ